MKFLIVLALIAVVAADNTYKSAPAYPAGYKTSYDYPPQPYTFNYDVKDDQYNNFGHQENADGKGYVTGSYHVVLPDGRHQYVTYKDEGYGLVAEVKTEGGYKQGSYPAPAAYSAKN